MALAGFALSSAPAAAQPARIIILRHGEKQGLYQLCELGERRAVAVASTYLGRDATASLTDGKPPAAILAVTLHSLELAAPTAASWNMPVITYAVIPLIGENNPEAEDPALNRATSTAVRDVMSDRRWTGKTVIMVWEHRHIADQELEHRFAPQRVTLRQLLGLHGLPGVPKNWEHSAYDDFWIVDYGNAGSATPTAFRVVKQQFAAPFDSLSQNNGDQRQKPPMRDRCTQ